MNKKRLSILLLGAFLALFVLHMPTLAHAADPDWKNEDCVEENKRLQQAQTVRAQYIAKSITNYYAYLPPIDLATYNCLKQIDTAMKALQSSFTFAGLVDAIIGGIVENLIGQVCSAVIQTATNIQNLIYSQINRLCVPIPNIGLDIDPLSFSGPPCEGTPLVRLTPYQSNGIFGPNYFPIYPNTRR